MGKIIDRTGQRFGRCTVLRFNSMRKVGADCRCVWDVRCDCGVEFTNYTPANLKQCNECHNKQRSKERTTHGESANKSGAYRTWTAMLRRCRDQNHKDYSRYGAIGITVCDRWDTQSGGSYLNFLEDMGSRPHGKTLNRVNGAMVYSKETCEWATIQEQVRDQKIRTTNKSGLRGVRIKKKVSGDEFYEVSIYAQGKYKYIGIFSDKESAFNARKEAEIKYYGKFYEVY